MKNRIVAKLEPTNDVCIKFSEEDMNILGLKETDKFSVEADKNTIRLIPYKSLEINLAEFSREELEHIIIMSCEKDISINQVFEIIVREIVGEHMPKHDRKNRIKKTSIP